MPILWAILTVLGTAASMLVLKGALAIWPVGLAGVLSRVVTLSALAAWVLARGAGWRRLLPRTQGGALLVMGGISIVVNLAWFAAMKLTTATNVAMLRSLDLAFVVLIGAGLGLERIGLRQLALVPVMLAGMALLTGVSASGFDAALLGDLLAVGAALAFAANAFIIRGILRHLDEEAVSLYNHGLSTLGFLALVAVGNEVSRAAGVWDQPSAWWWLVAVGVVAAVSLPVYYAALRRMEVWKLRAWLLSAPVLVAVLEWQFWGNRLSGMQWLGAAMVLGSLAVLIRLELRAAAAAAASSLPESPLPQPASTP